MTSTGFYVWTRAHKLINPGAPLSRVLWDEVNAGAPSITRFRLVSSIMSYIFFDRGFISLVYVDSAQRRRGVGTCLFDEFERRCQSNRIFTSANLSNLPMHAFLGARGYVLRGMVQDLDDGDPEMFFSKRLR